MPSDGDRHAKSWAAGIIGYTCIVFAIDTLATRAVSWPIDWHSLYWLQIHEVSGGWKVPGIDFFKLIFWFVIPAVVLFTRTDWSWFSPKLPNKWDRILIAAFAILGAAAVIAVPIVPSLRAMYPSLSQFPAEAKAAYLGHYTTWIISWIVGWEFLMRYAIPNALMRAWPQRGYIIAIILVPTIDVVYHVAQGKPTLECVGVALYSTALTAFATLRHNTLYPLIAHLAVEFALVALMLLV